MIAVPDTDPDDWWERSDVYAARQLTPEQKRPLEKFKASAGGRFYLLPEHENVNWMSKGVRAIYINFLRYIANQSFSPCQCPESNGVPVNKEHAKHIAAMVHVTDAKYLANICKYGLSPGGQVITKKRDGGDTHSTSTGSAGSDSEVTARTGSLDAQWTIHDPRDGRQQVHGRNLVTRCAQS